MLIGGWDESNKNDLAIIEEMVKQPYDEWIKEIRIYRNSIKNIRYSEYIWQISDQLSLWEEHAANLYSSHLDSFRRIFLKVYETHDPQFELEPEHRYAAEIFDKKFPYSKTLRSGLINALILLEIHSKFLVNIPRALSENFVSNLVDKLLSSVNWQLWAGIGDVFPTLAELAPNKFLENLDKLTRANKDVANDLFTQDRFGNINTVNYFSGITQALQVLAWKEDFFIRVVSVLARLDLLNPNKQSDWGDSPKNILKKLLLPWITFNNVSVERYQASVKALIRLNPKLAWKILTSVLIQKIAISQGDSKPRWRKWEQENSKQKLTAQQLTHQKSEIIEIAILELVEKNNKHLMRLVDMLPNLTALAFEKSLTLLEKQIVHLSQNEQDLLWEKIILLTNHHYFYQNSIWAMPQQQIFQIKNLVNNLSPSTLFIEYRHMFSDNWKGRFIYEDYDYEQKAVILDDKRCHALRSLIDIHGINAIFELATQVKPYYTLVKIITKEIKLSEITNIFLKDVLAFDCQNFSALLLSEMYKHHSFLLFEKINPNYWQQQDWLKLLLKLPATPNLWSFLIQILNQEYTKNYWEKVNLNPYRLQHILTNETEFKFCLFNLIEVKRFFSALTLIWCTRSYCNGLVTPETVFSLLYEVSRNENNLENENFENDMISDLIEFIQSCQSFTINQKANIEILYSEWIFNHFQTKIVATSIEKRMSEEPVFFFEWYKIHATDQLDGNDLLKSKSNEILNKVKRAPGLTDDGKFCAENFTNWINEVIEMAKEHNLPLDPIRKWLGKSLFYTPRDANDLWCQDVLNELNKDENSDLLDSFYEEIFLSRGVRVVDLTGKEEFELAQKYNKLSELTEMDGFYNIYSKLKSAANSFQWEAEATLKGELYRLPNNTNVCNEI